MPVASVVRSCTSSKAVMPLKNRNLAAVPEEAQKRAARAAKRYPDRGRRCCVTNVVPSSDPLHEDVHVGPLALETIDGGFTLRVPDDGPHDDTPVPRDRAVPAQQIGVVNGAC